MVPSEVEDHKEDREGTFSKREVSEAHHLDIQEEVSEDHHLDLQGTSSVSFAKLAEATTSSLMISPSVGFSVRGTEPTSLKLLLRPRHCLLVKKKLQVKTTTTTSRSSLERKMMMMDITIDN